METLIVVGDTHLGSQFTVSATLKQALRNAQAHFVAGNPKDGPYTVIFTGKNRIARALAVKQACTALGHNYQVHQYQPLLSCYPHLALTISPHIDPAPEQQNPLS